MMVTSLWFSRERTIVEPPIWVFYWRQQRTAFFAVSTNRCRFTNHIDRVDRSFHHVIVLAAAAEHHHTFGWELPAVHHFWETSVVKGNGYLFSKQANGTVDRISTRVVKLVQIQRYQFCLIRWLNAANWTSVIHASIFLKFMGLK